MLVSLIFMVFGAGFFSYTIGTLSNLLVNNESRKEKLRQKKMHMEAFMKENRFKTVFKRKLNAALNYNSTHTMFNQSEKNEFLHELPINLKYEIANSMYLNLNRKLVFFTGKEDSFLAEFMPWLSPIKFNKRDIIYHKNESPMFGILFFFLLLLSTNLINYLVYFIVSGRVALITGKYNTCFKTLVEGSYFGEIEIYENSSRATTVQACTECHLLTISKDDFEGIMSIFPDYDKEFREIAQKKLEKINESLEHIKDLQTIKLNSEFWRKQKQNIYQMAMEEKENSLAVKAKSIFSRSMLMSQTSCEQMDTPRPLLNKQTSIDSILGDAHSPKLGEGLIGGALSKMGSQENIPLPIEHIKTDDKIIRRSVSQTYVRLPPNLSTSPNHLSTLNEPSNSNDPNPPLNSNELKNPIDPRRTIMRRKSQFFYKGGRLSAIKEKIVELDKNINFDDLREKLKKSGEILNSSENQIKEIGKSIAEMRSFVEKLKENKKNRKKSILVGNFFEEKNL